MTFTYSSTTVTTTLAKVRLAIGDTDSSAALFTDEELQVYIDARGDNVNLAAADACDALATKFARAYDFETDGQRFERSQMAAMYREMADNLRARGHGVTSSTATRKDGYSDDLDNVTSTQNSSDANPRRKYYGQQDQLP